MVLVTVAAYGPEQLPPPFAWARALGVLQFRSITGLRIVCVAAHVVRGLVTA